MECGRDAGISSRSDGAIASPDRTAVVGGRRYAPRRDQVAPGRGIFEGANEDGEAHEVPLADQVIAILEHRQRSPVMAPPSRARGYAGRRVFTGKAGLDLLMVDVGARETPSPTSSRGSSTIFGGLARAARRNVDEVEGVARGPGRAYRSPTSTACKPMPAGLLTSTTATRGCSLRVRIRCAPAVCRAPTNGTRLRSRSPSP